MPDTPRGGPGRRRLIRLGVGLAALLLLGVGTVGVLRSRHTGGNTPTGDPAAGGTPSAAPSTSPSPTPEPGADITGPLTLLLVGVDTRISVPGWEPHADAVLVLHVARGLDRAYLYSLPRDLVVDIPAFAPARFPGQRTKLTHAMSYGSRVPGRRDSPDPAQGFRLLEQTVLRYTGIKRFDAGAVLTFGGLTKLVDAVGGVDLTIDQRVVSKHRRPDGSHRKLVGGDYVGPQMVYQPGPRHLVGWQALDYARQRYITGGDYSRQRHQQQLIKALVAKMLDQGLARDAERLEAVVRSLGDALIPVTGGRRIIDFGYALSRLPPAAITLVSLPGHGVGRGAGYRGEALDAIGVQFLAELRAGRADAFLTAHPELVVKD
ncbi:LCP family protein [Plantactinospora sp. GCM10030261]|uniref:LCP family protein n=1 Tax=Plantactinospora sp. GCM10030261 TaxID=3273420 RepID=UPI00361249CF